MVIHPSYLKSYLVDITLKHLRWLPCLCPPKPSTSFAWPPGDVHQWSFSRSALKGGNHLFSKGSLFLRGLPCPREKQHLFYKEFLLILKTPLQAFFPKAATSPSDFFSIAAFFAKAVGLLCFHAAFFPKAIAVGILLKALPNLPQLPQNQGTLGSPAFWPTGASPNKCKWGPPSVLFPRTPSESLGCHPAHGCI